MMPDCLLRNKTEIETDDGNLYILDNFFKTAPIVVITC